MLEVERYGLTTAKEKKIYRRGVDCRQVCLEQGEDQTGTRTCQVAQKTVDFVDDLCLGAAEALSATTAKALVEERRKKRKR